MLKFLFYVRWGFPKAQYLASQLLSTLPFQLKHTKLLYDLNEKMHYIRVVQESKFMFMTANLTFL